MNLLKHTLELRHTAVDFNEIRHHIVSLIESYVNFHRLYEVVDKVISELNIDEQTEIFIDLDQFTVSKYIEILHALKQLGVDCKSEQISIKLA